MEVQWTRPPTSDATGLPPAAPPRGCFSFSAGEDGAQDPSTASWDMLERAAEEPEGSAAAAYWPIFAIASAPSNLSATARADLKVSAPSSPYSLGSYCVCACVCFPQAQLWVDQKGRLHTMSGICSTGPASGGSNCLQSGKWHHVSVVVDCVCGELEVYLDGVCVHSKGSDSSAESRLKPPGIDIIDG
jgi:hypothetical protein